MQTTPPVVVQYSKDFRFQRIWKILDNFFRATNVLAEVQFSTSTEIIPTLRGRHFKFVTAQMKGKEKDLGKTIIAVQIREVVLGMETEICNVLQYKDVKHASAAVRLLNGNVVDEEFIEQLLKITEATIRKHPEYKEFR